MVEPQPQPGDQTGGVGGLFEQPGGRVRESLVLIQRAATGGWNIPPKWFDTLPQIAAQIALDTDAPKRDRLRALEVLRAMARDRLDAAKELDHVERLASGEATDILRLQDEAEERKKLMADPVYRRHAVEAGRRAAALRRGEVDPLAPDNGGGDNGGNGAGDNGNDGNDGNGRVGTGDNGH